MELTKQSCEDFLALLASNEPVPGGGGAAALVGAVGVALGNMVGSLTAGKKKYADVQEDILALNDTALALRRRLVELVAEDATAFAPLSRAYGLPTGTEEEKAHKAAVMAQALDVACATPLELMETLCQAIDLHRDYAQKGTAIAISDVGVGVACCKAALQGASLNVFINTKSMADRAKAEAINQKAHAMLDTYCALADGIFADVAKRFE